MDRYGEWFFQRQIGDPSYCYCSLVPFSFEMEENLEAPDSREASSTAVEIGLGDISNRVEDEDEEDGC